ncbi:MAG: sulfatase-like hydrolase/transferase [Phycisphaeraceae bacterium]|nr:sulfatase-like hydrolase/transferase [Phycisphaeraceae bacterium]
MLSDRPNILCIMSDEHDPAVTSCYGDPLVQTPNLDSLASGGVTFDAACCNSPLCVPSRLSFTAGRYVSRCAAWTNDCRLPSDDYPSLPRALRAAGYDPVLCGKQHYDPRHRYGFDELYPASTNQHRMNGRTARRAPDDFTPDLTNWRDRSAKFHPGDRSHVLDHDLLVTQNACRFLNNRSRDDRPFFLFAGYLAPHFPLIAPQAHADRYLGKTPPPVIPPGLLDSLPTNYKHLRAGFGLEQAVGPIVQTGRDLYWALVDWFDGQIGQLLAALRASAVAENTVILYTSDHGENKGDHGLWWKNCMFDHAVRIPLIIHWPQRWPTAQRRPGVCSLVDLVQTMTSLAGARPGDDWNGDSLLPLLDNPAAPWKDMAVSEYYGHNIASGYTMLRQGPWKYVYHNPMDERHGPERELYDLATDPRELRNLAADPAHAPRIAAMHAAMLKELAADPDEIEQRSRADLARGYA